VNARTPASERAQSCRKPYVWNLHCLDPEWDLYYEAAVVNAKTSPAPGSWCPREDFYNVRAVASCSIGAPPNGLDCGAGWAHVDAEIAASPQVDQVPGSLPT
jgi:hypothetical protein